MTNLVFVSIAIFCTYVAFIWGKYGILPDISTSYYRMGMKPYFTFVMWATGFTALIGTVEQSGFMFASASGIMFVGAAAAFREQLTSTVHYLGAVGAILFGLVAHLTLGNYIPVAIFFLGAIPLLYAPNKIWWIEILAFLCITIPFVI
jgi:hypothetical protein